MKKTIKFGENGLVGTFTPLIPFSCIYDIPVGLIILIQKEYRAGNIFDIDKIDSLCKNRRKLIYTLYQRRFENPLIEFMIKSDYEEAENLYNQFIEKEYQPILDNCVHTGIYELCTFFLSSPEVKPTIYCRNEIEKEIFQQDPEIGNFDIIYKKGLASIKSFDQYFINSIFGPYVELLMKNIDHKSIYIMDYKYNFDPNTEYFVNSPAIEGFEITRNELFTIGAYDLSRLID